MRQGAELQIDDDEAAQPAMEEQQIDPIPGLVNAHTALPPDEGEPVAEFEQEILQPPDQG